MEKIKITQKYEQIIFKYNNLKRYLIVFVFLLMSLLGVSLILLGYWFLVLLGILILIISLYTILDILFFKSLIFKDNSVIKEWYLFGSKEIKFENLEVSVNKRVWTGLVFFGDKNKGYLTRLVMQFEIFPIGNKGFIEIRELLIAKKIIKGDENGWNY